MKNTQVQYTFFQMQTLKAWYCASRIEYEIKNLKLPIYEEPKHVIHCVNKNVSLSEWRILKRSINLKTFDLNELIFQPKYHQTISWKWITNENSNIFFSNLLKIRLIFNPFLRWQRKSRLSHMKAVKEDVFNQRKNSFPFGFNQLIQHWYILGQDLLQITWYCSFRQKIETKEPKKCRWPNQPEFCA